MPDQDSGRIWFLITIVLLSSLSGSCRQPKPTQIPHRETTETPATMFMSPLAEPSATPTVVMARPSTTPTVMIARPPTRLPTDTPDPDRTPVAIVMAEIEPDREVITIKNVSSVKQDIGLWTLFNLRGGPPFHFPEDLVLQPGESVEVYSAVREEQVPEGAFFWTEEKIWHEVPADVLLVNQVTRLMYWYVHYGDRIDQ